MQCQQAAAADLEGQLAALRQALAASEAEIEQLRAQASAASAKLDASVAEREQLAAQLREAAAAQAALRQKVSNCEAQVQGLQAGQQQLSRQLQCMCGSDEAVAQQSADTLDSLVAVIEAALPKLRATIMEKRVQAARFEAAASQQGEAACGVCLAAPRDTFLNCGHLLCRGCSTRLERCPHCRAVITSRARAFV